MDHEFRHIQVIRRRMYRPPRCTDHSEGNEIRGLATSMTQQPAVLYAGAMVRPCAGSTPHASIQRGSSPPLTDKLPCWFLRGGRAQPHVGLAAPGVARKRSPRHPADRSAPTLSSVVTLPLVPTAVSVVPIRGIVTLARPANNSQDQGPARLFSARAKTVLRMG
jgi:hypothetical protein